MNRRAFCAMLASVSVADPVCGEDSDPPGVAAQNRYDEMVDAIIRRADGGFLLGSSLDRERVRVVATDSAGTPQTRREIDVPVDRALYDNPNVALTHTSEGYAVGAGPWIALLDRELTVTAKTVSPEIVGSGNTEIQIIGDKVIVARESVYPNAAGVDVDAYDETGAHRWHREVGDESFRRFGFLVRGSEGPILGGEENGTLWTARFSSGGDRRGFSRHSDVAVDQEPAGVKTPNGLLVFNAPTFTRLDEAGNVVSQRTHDQFDQEFQQLTRLSTGEVLAATDQTVGRFTADGSVRWIRSYQQAGAGSIYGLAASGPDTFAVVGGKLSGWFVRFSPAVTPTDTPTEPATPTDTPTEPATPTESATEPATPTDTPTESATPNPPETVASSEPQTAVRTDGFGAGIGVGTLAALSGWFARRTRNGTDES